MELYNEGMKLPSGKIQILLVAALCSGAALIPALSHSQKVGHSPDPLIQKVTAPESSALYKLSPAKWADHQARIKEASQQTPAPKQEVKPLKIETPAHQQQQATGKSYINLDMDEF